MQKSKKYQSIPTNLTEPQFNEFVLPYLTKGSRGPNTKISFYRIFNYVLKLMHTGGFVRQGTSTPLIRRNYPILTQTHLPNEFHLLMMLPTMMPSLF